MQTLQQLISGQLTGASKIKISEQLTEFPEAIFDLADTLEFLDLAGNRLSRLPATFGRLKKLKIAFFSENDFTEFPAVLGECKNLEMVGFKANKIKRIPEKALPASLRWLILTDNGIEKLPESIGSCLNLLKVMLAGNKLQMLPETMKNCRQIELLRLSANELSALPGWLFSLPKLAWLAFAGNPCSRPEALPENLPEIPWNSLVMNEKLGEGASGTIWKATISKAGLNLLKQEAAVKIFKGAVTSDGLPADEMNAAATAGAHPNLVAVSGKICGHPAGKQGLVLNLIPPDYRNLGNPPSFQTCTRDTFPEGAVFSLTEVVKISAGIASAALHLHTRKCMHGDLYAHNILVNGSADSLFGDFGAATLYQQVGAGRAEAIEKIEVRAFGCLLDDLLTRLRPAEKTNEKAWILTDLMQKCLDTSVLKRPFFREITELLNGLG